MFAPDRRQIRTELRKRPDIAGCAPALGSGRPDMPPTSTARDPPSTRSCRRELLRWGTNVSASQSCGTRRSHAPGSSDASGAVRAERLTPDHSPPRARVHPTASALRRRTVGADPPSASGSPTCSRPRIRAILPPGWTAQERVTRKLLSISPFARRGGLRRQRPDSVARSRGGGNGRQSSMWRLAPWRRGAVPRFVWAPRDGCGCRCESRRGTRFNHQTASAEVAPRGTDRLGWGKSVQAAKLNVVAQLAPEVLASRATPGEPSSAAWRISVHGGQIWRSSATGSSSVQEKEAWKF